MNVVSRVSLRAVLKTPRPLFAASVARANARMIITSPHIPILPSRLASSAAAFTARTRETPRVEEKQEDVLPEEEPEADAPVPFRTIQRSVHPKTYAALTSAPFNYKDMSPVQAEVLALLPQLAEPYREDSTDASKAPPRDLLVKAKTGTGKTLAFLVPATEMRLKVLKDVGQQAVRDSGSRDARLAARAESAYARKNVGTLVISPTRELAIQIANEAMKSTSHHRHNVHLFVGGENKGRQLSLFNRGSRDIVVATPGRLRDLLENTPDIKDAFQNLNTLVFDEADTLLDMGFRADIEAIISDLPPPPVRQTFLFSATVSPAIRDIARQSLDKNHLFINCVKEDDSPVHAHIPQHYTILPSAAEQIPHTLRLIAQDQLQNPGTSKVILFCGTTKATALMADIMRDLRAALPNRRTNIMELHSKMTQNARRRTSDQFRHDNSGAVVLITSDVSARGVDYPNVTRVIQLGVPANGDQYIHRVGRTGRGQNMKGRGDLVLLPLEREFPQGQLDSVPIKSVTMSQVEEEILKLAEEYDANPNAFFKDVKKPWASQSPKRNAVLPEGRSFGPNVRERLENLPAVVDTAIDRLDKVEVEGAFMAMLGYVISTANELRLPKPTLLEGCKDWCRDAFRIEPPHVSDAFLQRMGWGSKEPPARHNRSSRSSSVGSRYGSPRRNEWVSPQRWGGRDRYGSDRDHRPSGDRWSDRKSQDRYATRSRSVDYSSRGQRQDRWSRD